MLRRISLLVTSVLVCIALLGGVACRKVERRVFPKGNLNTQAHPFLDAIPSEYGELEGIIPGDSGWAVLVFEKADNSLVMLAVNPYRGGMAENAVLIPRK